MNDIALVLLVTNRAPDSDGTAAAHDLADELRRLAPEKIITVATGTAEELQAACAGQRLDPDAVPGIAVVVAPPDAPGLSSLVGCLTGMGCVVVTLPVPHPHAALPEAELGRLVRLLAACSGVPGSADDSPETPLVPPQAIGVTARDRGYLRELRSQLDATSSELHRVRKSWPWRIAASARSTGRASAQLARRVAHPVETVRLLTSAHLPPRVRAWTVRLLSPVIGLRQGNRRPEPIARPPQRESAQGRPRPAVIMMPPDSSPPKGGTRAHHLASHLKELGWPILWLATRGTGTTTSSQLDSTTWTAELDLPPGTTLEGIDEATVAAWCERLAELRRSARLRGAVMVVGALAWWPLAERLRRTFGWPIVYDRTARRWQAKDDGARMRSAEARVMREADGIWASSAKLERSAPATSHFITRIGNGCDPEKWAAAGPLPGDQPPEPRVGSHARIDGLFDVELLRELARARPGWSFVLGGAEAGAPPAALAALPNVYFAAPASPQETVALVRSFDVGILPFVNSRLAEGHDPQELYEMVAAGIEVVATPLPEIVAHRAAVTADGPREFLAAIEDCLAAPGRPERDEARHKLIREGTWVSRASAAEGGLEAAFPLLSVVIATFNNEPLTRLCLDSLFTVNEYPNIEVVVVDNASSDETRDTLAAMSQRHANLKVLLNETNRGFAAATNQGIRASSGEILCMLNNDTVVTAGALSVLLHALLTDPQLGMVGPVTNAAGNEARIRVKYATLDELPAWAERYTWAHDGESFEIPMLALFCTALRRSVWDQVGELDEQYEIGMFEDDDYCRRVRGAGLVLRCRRDAYVHHWQRASFRLLGDEVYWRTYTANRARFQAKWRSR